MSKNLLITLVGIGAQHEGKQYVAKGCEVICQFQPHNQYDKDALAIYIEKDGAMLHAGYAGNKESTVFSHTLSASEFKAEIRDNKFSTEDPKEYLSGAQHILGKVIGEGFVEMKSGSKTRQSKAFAVEIEKPIESQYEQTDTIETFPIKIEGKYADFSARESFLESIVESMEKSPTTESTEAANHGTAIIKKDPSNGNSCLVYSPEGLEIGFIGGKASKGYTSATDIISAMNTLEVDEMSADIYRARRGSAGGTIMATVQVDHNVALEQKAKQEAEELIKDLEFVANQGLDSKDNVLEKIAYMKKCDVSNSVITKVFETYKHYPSEVKSQIEGKPQVLYVDDHGLIKKGLGYVLAGNHLLLEGPRGVGKNVYEKTITWLFNRPSYTNSVNMGFDKYDAIGSKTFADAMDESTEESVSFVRKVHSFSTKVKLGCLAIPKLIKGAIKVGPETELEEETALSVFEVFKKTISYFSGKKLVYEKSVMMEAAENGGVFVLDELNTVLPSALSIFNSILDDRRTTTVQGYGKIKADDNFFAIATLNRDYQGTFEQNEATIDRFVPIVFPEINTIEPILQSKAPNLDSSVYALCQRVFEGIMGDVRNGDISEKSITIRGFIAACKAVEYDIPLKEGLLDNVANKATTAEDRVLIENIIDIVL